MATKKRNSKMTRRKKPVKSRPWKFAKAEREVLAAVRSGKLTEATFAHKKIAFIMALGRLERAGLIKDERDVMDDNRVVGGWKIVK